MELKIEYIYKRVGRIYKILTEKGTSSSSVVSITGNLTCHSNKAVIFPLKRNADLEAFEKQLRRDEKLYNETVIYKFYSQFIYNLFTISLT